MKIHKKFIAIAFAVAITINSGILTVLANNEQADSTIKQVDLYPIESESNDIFESENTETHQDLLCPCMTNTYNNFSNLEILSDEENEINISYPENTLYEYTLSGNIINLSDYEYITNSAFSNMNEEFTVKIDSDNPPIIEEYALSNPNLSCIMLDNEELSYTDLQLKDDEYYITCGDSHAGIFKDENSFKIQLIKAIMNNENYRDKLEDDFCQKIIEENKWRSLAEEDPYEAYYEIFSWVCKNRPYMGWWSETTEHPTKKSYNNKIYYDYSQTISSHTLGGAITGYTICGGHARTIDDIIKNLNVGDIIQSKPIFDNGHAWNLIGIRVNLNESMKWYYSDIGLTMNGNKNTANNVSLMGHDYIKKIAYIYGKTYNGFYLENDNLEAFKKYLINNNIIYNGIKEYEIKTEENCGELAESSYDYNKKHLDIKVHKIAMETNDIISLSLPENIISYEYHNKEESQGYYVFSDEDIDNIIINTFVKKYNMLLVADFSDTLINGNDNSIFGGSAKFNDGYEVYIR